MLASAAMLGLFVAWGPWARAAAPVASETWIAVVSHAWHTDIAVRMSDITGAPWPDADRFAGAAFIEIGWGDRDFFMARQETLALAWQAAFRSRGSALRVIWGDRPVDQYFVESDVVEVPIARSHLPQLVAYIRDSYALSAVGEPIDLGPGPWPASRYYLATGRYRLFSSSNQWTARALRSAGLPFVPEHSLTVGAVLCQAAQIGRVVRLRHECRSPHPPRQSPEPSPPQAAPRIISIRVTARSQSKAVVMSSRPAAASRARCAVSRTRRASLVARSSTSRRRATRAVTPSTA